MSVKFQIKNVKPIKVGKSYYFTIPKQFVNNGLVLVNEEYNLNVTKVDTNEA